MPLSRGMVNTNKQTTEQCSVMALSTDQRDNAGAWEVSEGQGRM